MSKNRNARNTAKPQDEDTSKLAALVVAEEEIIQDIEDNVEVDTTDTTDEPETTGEKYEDPTATDPKNGQTEATRKTPDPKVNTKDKGYSTKGDPKSDQSKLPKESVNQTRAVEPDPNAKIDGLNVDGVRVDPEEGSTYQPINGKNGIDTMGDVHLDENVVLSRAETLGEAEQDGVGDRHVSSPGIRAMVQDPNVGSLDGLSAPEIAALEGEAVSNMVNHALPNKPAPEQVHETVKADEMITRVADYHVDLQRTQAGNQRINNPKVEGLGAPENLAVAKAMKHDMLLVDAAGKSTGSVESPNIDEIAIPVGEMVMSERDLQIARMQSMASPILGGRSTQDLIDRRRPVNVFQAMAQSTAAPNTHEEAATPDDMKKRIKDNIGVDIDADNTPDFLKKLVGTLDDYVKKMAPRTPVTNDEIVDYQMRMLTALSNSFARPSVSEGLTALKIFEQYFRSYSGGAFGGSYPFRAFNQVNPKLGKLSNVLYAMQNIVQKGREAALADVSKQKLKESVDTNEAQVMLLSYLNS